MTSLKSFAFCHFGLHHYVLREPPSFDYFLLRSHRAAVALVNKTGFAGREAKSSLLPGNPRHISH
jgi:hypothetical protein